MPITDITWNPEQGQLGQGSNAPVALLAQQAAPGIGVMETINGGSIPIPPPTDVVLYILKELSSGAYDIEKYDSAGTLINTTNILDDPQFANFNFFVQSLIIYSSITNGDAFVEAFAEGGSSLFNSDPFGTAGYFACSSVNVSNIAIGFTSFIDPGPLQESGYAILDITDGSTIRTKANLQADGAFDANGGVLRSLFIDADGNTYVVLRGQTVLGDPLNTVQKYDSTDSHIWTSNMPGNGDGNNVINLPEGNELIGESGNSIYYLYQFYDLLVAYLGVFQIDKTTGVGTPHTIEVLYNQLTDDQIDGVSGQISGDLIYYLKENATVGTAIIAVCNLDGTNAQDLFEIAGAFTPMQIRAVAP